MMKGVVLTSTVSGRVRLETNKYWSSWYVSFLLMFNYGFTRKGKYMPPLTDESIYPDFIKGDLKICAGWDVWFGYDWFADNDKTDQFLKKFDQKHCQ